MARKQELMKNEEKLNGVTSLNNVPDYLQNQKFYAWPQHTGLEKLGEGDFKTPRIIILQANNPEVRTFQGKAIPSEFWHQTANRSLGASFKMIPLIVSKKVILWRPRHEGGGILAFSKDGVNWDSGANQTFKIKPYKDNEKIVSWTTGKSVGASGLLEWGKYDFASGNEKTPPAATMHYEYLVYLPDFPELSPSVIGLAKTATQNAKSFNTDLLQLRRPAFAVQVNVFSEEKTKDKDHWFTPKFELDGYISKETYEITSKMYEQFQNYDTTYDQEETSTNTESHEQATEDEIPF